MTSPRVYLQNGPIHKAILRYRVIRESRRPCGVLDFWICDTPNIAIPLPTPYAEPRAA